MLRVGLYARVSTHHQQTLPLQLPAMREYAAKRGWEIALQIKKVGSGVAERELREKLMAAARPSRNRRGAGAAVGPLGTVTGRSGRDLKGPMPRYVLPIDTSPLRH